MLFYTHVNEDNAVELSAMAEWPVQDLYVVAGSGERVLALLDHPTLTNVFIIDINPHALYLCALKLKALERLSVEEYLQFTGITESNAADRLEIYKRLEPELTEPCRKFWSEHGTELGMGICNSGHFERFLQNARPWLRFFLGPSFYQALEKPRSEWRHFPSWRWAIVKWLFSRRFTYSLFGMKDMAFLSENAELEIIPEALQHTLDHDQTPSSCLFHLVFNGHIRAMPETNRPPSFQIERLQRIQSNLQAKRFELTFLEGDIREILRDMPHQDKRFRFFSLSDVLSFISIQELKILLDSIAAHSKCFTRVVFRAFVRNRPDKDELKSIHYAAQKFTDLSASEKTHFYQVFQIDFNHEP